MQQHKRDAQACWIHICGGCGATHLVPNHFRSLVLHDALLLGELLPTGELPGLWQRLLVRKLSDLRWQSNDRLFLRVGQETVELICKQLHVITRRAQQVLFAVLTKCFSVHRGGIKGAEVAKVVLEVVLLVHNY